MGEKHMSWTSSTLDRGRPQTESPLMGRLVFDSEPLQWAFMRPMPSSNASVVRLHSPKPGWNGHGLGICSGVGLDARGQVWIAKGLE